MCRFSTMWCTLKMWKRWRYYRDSIISWVWISQYLQLWLQAIIRRTFVHYELPLISTSFPFFPVTFIDTKPETMNQFRRPQLSVKIIENLLEYHWNPELIQFQYVSSKSYDLNCVVQGFSVHSFPFPSPLSDVVWVSHYYYCCTNMEQQQQQQWDKNSHFVSTAGWLSFPAPSPYELDAIKRVEAKEEKKNKLTKSISRTQFTVFIFFHFARSFIATLRIYNLFLFCNAAGLWSRKKAAATTGAHKKVKGKVSGWAKQREWKKKLNRKAPAVWREKLLANVFEDYLFSFLFSHFTISHFYLFESSHTPRQPCAICMHVTSTPRARSLNLNGIYLRMRWLIRRCST